MSSRVVIILAVFATYFTAAKILNVDTKFPKIFKWRQPGSHFGYTVAFHRNSVSNTIWAMIGAPKANSSVMASGVEQPGAVFKCDINFFDCKEVAFDTTGNDRTNLPFEKVNPFTDLKDNMFLGGSIDSGYGNFIACAHLWKNKAYKELYLANGLCYVINENFDIVSTKRLTPLLNIKKQTEGSTYKYAFGMAGMSSEFTDDGLLLGAPGISTYIGSNVFYEIDNPGKPFEITRSIVPPVLDRIGVDSYFGYAVTSGKFYDSKTYFVSGAPKANETGRVYIYHALGYQSEGIIVKEEKSGTLLGEHFGSVLCATNLNNDGYDDLLIGSPLYFSKEIMDHGKVQVYVSDGQRLKLQEYVLTGLMKPNSRFGSAISAIGDLNQDGFNDVVIGAPYEENIGAIYIYHGSFYGINPTFDQRILAREVGSNLKGFGISIARGDDMDGNYYNDLLIGSYESESAVLLRTRPVVKVGARIEFNVPFLDLNKTLCFFENVNLPCFKTTACLTYTGNHVPFELDFNVLFEMETLRKLFNRDSRGYVLYRNRKVQKVNLVKRLFLDQEGCEEFSIHIKKNPRDVITPLQFKLTFTLKEDESGRFNAEHPVMDESIGNTVTNQLLLNTNCGNDNECNADLKLELSVKLKKGQSSLLIGETKDVLLEVQVTNLNETAIQSFIVLEFQKEIEFKNLGGCEIPSENVDDDKSTRRVTDPSNKILVCKTAEILKRNAQEKFNIKLGILALEPNSNLVVKGEAKTKSTEKYLLNNQAQISLKVVALADITIRGSTQVPQIAYETDQMDRKKIAKITHSYRISKKEASPIKLVKVTLAFPYTSVNLVPLIRFNDVKVGGGVEGSCDTENIPFARRRKQDDDDKVIQQELDMTSKTSKYSSRLGVPEQRIDGKARAKRETAEKQTRNKLLKSKIGTALNCSNVKCVAISCYFGPFKDNAKTGIVHVSFELNITSIFNLPFLKDEDTVMVESTGSAKIKDRHISLPTPEASKTDTVVTTLFSTKSLKDKPVALWVIIVSAIAGILVLLIILLILIKVGFFKRTVKEDMEKLKAKSEITEWEKLVQDPPPADV